MSELLWLAVPGGAITPDGAVLRALVVPRLHDGGPDLESYGLTDWPALLARASLTVRTGTDPGAEGTPVGDAVQIDRTRPGTWAKVFPPTLAVRPYTAPLPRRAPEVDRSTEHRDAIDGIYSASARAPGDADTVHRALTSADLGTARPAPTVEPPRTAGPGPDFHRSHSLLREHPPVLEALGLIVTFRLPTPTALGASGLIRVSCVLDGFTTISPWTQYECDDTRFLPAPEAGSDLVRGMIDLTAAHWKFATFDVSGGIERVRDAARTAQESSSASSLPALRSAGLSLLRDGRDQQLGARVAAANGRGSVSDSTVLTADALILGYRVDVRTSDGNWSSLMARSASYTTVEGELIAELEEEGQVKANGMTVADDPEPVADQGVDQRTFRADEVVSRWDGWSLAVPRRLDRPRRRGRLTGTGLEGALPFLRWDYTALRLPTLRFGQQYRMRVRVADFAGGGLLLDQPELTEAESQEVFYGRHDPVPPPVLVPPDALTTEPPDPVAVGPGGAVDVLVIRSDPLSGTTAAQYAAEYPANDRRVLLPPPGSFALAEQHGRLDTANPEVVAPWLRRALAPQQYSADGSYSWLPDPVVEGVSMFIRPEPGTQSPGATRKEAWSVPVGTWPDLPAKTLMLQAVTGAAATLDWITQGRVGVVRLAPGRQVTLELTSSVVSEDIDHFVMRNWLTGMPPSRGMGRGGDPVEQIMDRARDGRHPMVSPPRIVRLVHATQRPVRRPVAVLKALRAPGDTAAVIADPVTPLLGLDPPSTAQVELSASWRERTDDVLADPIPSASITVVRLDPDAPAVPPMRHEFGDSRHRTITYTVTATSRFRQYFTDDPAHPDDAKFQAPPLTLDVNVPSTARPPAPSVRSVVPAFRWTGRERPDGWTQLERVRAGGVVRVELDRPWHASGDGELLAVLVPDPSEPADVHRYVSTAHRDPIWATPPVEGTLHTDMFSGIASGDVTVALEEIPANVKAVPFAVQFAPDRDGRPAHWFADVGIPVIASMSYTPFVRLALARYQPSSLGGLWLSQMVRTEPVQLLPERRLSVTRTADSVRIVLAGQGPLLAQDAELGGEDRPDMPMANHLLAYLEFLPAQAGRPDVTAVAQTATTGWQRVPDSLAVGSLTDAGASDGLVIAGVDLAVPAGDGPLRLVVREVEWFPGSPSILGLPADAVHQRTVFADVIPLRG